MHDKSSSCRVSPEDVVHEFTERTQERFICADRYFFSWICGTEEKEKCVRDAMKNIIPHIMKLTAYIVEEFFQYCFKEHSIQRQDEQFQITVAQNCGPVISTDCCIKYIYILKNVLVPETIRKRFEDDSGKIVTLLNALVGSSDVFSCAYEFSDDQVDEIFKIFDGAQFSYDVEKGGPSILSAVLRTGNPKFIRGLFQRKCVIFDCDYAGIGHFVYKTLTYGQSLMDYYAFNLSQQRHKLCKLVLDSDANILKFFEDKYAEYHGDDFGCEENDSECVDMLKKLCVDNQIKCNGFWPSDEEFYSNVHPLSIRFIRSLISRPCSEYDKIIEVLEILRDNGLDLQKKIEFTVGDIPTRKIQTTFIDLYMTGCAPIRVLRPKYHEKLTKFFSS